ncbi:MAG: SRPBCC family protein [Thermomicrobiales bacterium]
MGKTVSMTQIVAEPGTQQIEITREFNAPRELLFRAFTEPDLVVQWLGPRDLTMTLDYSELRDGGRWRFIHTDADGNEYGFRGVLHGDPSVDGITRTFEYEGAPGHVSLERATFEDRGGRTLLRTLSVFQSVADRDAMIASGMEYGVKDSMDRLEDLLERLAR